MLELLAVGALLQAAPSAPAVEIAGAWVIRVQPGTVVVGARKVIVEDAVELRVMPPIVVKTVDEKYANLPAFNGAAAGWTKGARLVGVITSETTAAGILYPDSLVVKPDVGTAPPFVRGKDYDADLYWGTFGRLPGGIPEGATVYVDYDIGLHRIDSVVVDAQGHVTVRPGDPHNATPHPPKLSTGEVAIANLWVPARLEALGPDSLYPIIEREYRPPARAKAPAATLLPKTWAKLRDGKPVHVLAWGDSVTAGGEASSVEMRWQNQFVTMLKKEFPKAEVKLTTAGWGGRNSDSFLNEPPGAEFNFERAVLAPRPDLVVMEFVNDAGFTPEVVEKKYSYLLGRFREVGAEWAILTPHFVRPDWMGADTVKIETDPRPYVAGVRAFAMKHKVALADASLRYGHLVKEGIPYLTLMVNAINHPDDRGHRIFALSLMELFTTNR